MIPLENFATLAAATVLATAAAAALDWLLLTAAFRILQPATAQRSVPSLKFSDTTNAANARGIAVRKIEKGATQCWL